MKLQMMAVKDSATEAFARPFFTASINQALRSFRDEVNRNEPGNDLAKHSDDFTLYHLGELDDNTGQLQATIQPIARAKDLKENDK